jgi:hypothetical protein
MGFDFISYLKKRLMLGVVDPWRKTMDDNPIFTLIVDLNTAYEECKNWSGQDISKTEFTNYLKINDIYLFKNIDEFKSVKDQKEVKSSSTKTKKTISPERKEMLRLQMAEINNKKKTPFSKTLGKLS